MSSLVTGALIIHLKIGDTSKTCHYFIRGNSSAKIFQKTDISYPLPLNMYTYACVSGGQGVRNVTFSENFAYLLNE